MHEIKSAKRIRSIKGDDSILEDPREQIAFVGRSNVGKSSVINSLANRSDMAAASATPGKTQTIDFYLINDQFYFVDLPGFGYTKTSASGAQKLREMILWYLAGQPARPQLVILTVDAKAGITRKDEDMLDILEGERYPTLVLINKIDKLNQSQRASRMKSVEKKIAERSLPDVQIQTFSIENGQKRKEVISIIDKYLQSV